jgi:hypothetical protein
LQILDHRRSYAHEGGDLLVAQPLRRRRVHGSGSRGEICLQGSGALGEHHPHTALVGTVWNAIDQAVPLHPLQRVRHGRLLDTDPITQFALGQVILFVQRQ